MFDYSFTFDERDGHVFTVNMDMCEFTFSYIGGGYVRSGDYCDGRHYEDCYGWFMTNPDMNLYQERLTERRDYDILDRLLDLIQ